MKVDSEISRAIDRYLHDNKLTYDDFSKLMKVSPACITKWRKIGNGITNHKWGMIFPLIKKYLPADRIFIDDAGKEQYSSATLHQSSYVFEPKYIPLMVPTFQLAELADFDDTLESIIQFGERSKVKLSEYRPKHPDMSGIFAIVVADNSLAPVLPEKTKLFACTGERPNDGCLVVANSANGKPVIGRYKRSKSNFYVSSVIDDKDLISGEIKDARNIITWIFPVLYYEVVTF